MRERESGGNFHESTFTVKCKNDIRSYSNVNFHIGRERERERGGGEDFWILDVNFSNKFDKNIFR